MSYGADRHLICSGLIKQVNNTTRALTRHGHHKLATTKSRRTGRRCPRRLARMFHWGEKLYSTA